MRLMHTSLQHTRWWFAIDTTFAAVLVVVAIWILAIRPLPQLWQNVVLGVCAAVEAILWLWLLSRRAKPETVHPVFLRVSLLVLITAIAVSSHAWQHLRY